EYNEPEVEEEEDEMDTDEMDDDDGEDIDDETKGRRLDDEVENVWHDLKAVREPVPVQMNGDWRVALITAYRDYKTKKTIEAIPAAYDEYLMRLETGIGFEAPEQKEIPQYM